MSARAPRFLTDLYADLRDRRLLLPVAFLAIAIVTVPLLLKSDPAPPPPAMSSPELTADEAAATPAVVAAEPDLRDYRERLENLNSKNPFGKGSDASDSTAGAGVTVVPVDGSGTLSGLEPADDGSSETVDSVEPAPSPTASAPAPVTSETSSESETKSTEDKSSGDDTASPEQVEVAYRADLRVGRAGELERRKNVKLLTVLPNRANPVAIFLGASEGGKEAVFMVSSDVEGAEGEGSCLPSGEDCQFLILKPEESMKLHYAGGEETETYVIRLLELRLEPVKTKKQDSDEEKSSSVEDDLAAWLGI